MPDDKTWQYPKYHLTEFNKLKRTKYCVCIPIINEGIRIQTQLKKMKKLASVIDIILLDGGSSDGSMDPKFLKAQRVKALLVKIGPGKQGSQLRMGFAYAMQQGYQGVITVDGNNKDGVEAITNFIKYLDRGYDLVLGSRFIKGGKHQNTPLSRLLAVRFLASPLLSLASRRWYTDVTNGFRAYSRRYLLHPKVQPFRDPFYSYEMIMYLTVRASQVGLKTTEIPVTRIYPQGQVPTTIVGLSHNKKFLLTQLEVALGHFNPPD